MYNPKDEAFAEICFGALLKAGNCNFTMHFLHWSFHNSFTSLTLKRRSKDRKRTHAAKWVATRFLNFFFSTLYVYLADCFEFKWPGGAQALKIMLYSELFPLLTGGLFETLLIIRILIEACSLWSIKGSTLSLITQRWFLGAGWHDPVTQTLKRHQSDRGSRTPEHHTDSSGHYFSVWEATVCLHILLIFYEWQTHPTHYRHFISQVTNLHSVSDMFSSIVRSVAPDMRLSALLYFHNCRVVLIQCSGEDKKH